MTNKTKRVANRNTRGESANFGLRARDFPSSKTSEHQLSEIEQNLERLNRLAKTWNVATISRIRGDLKETRLKKALKLLQSRHPQLRARIVGKIKKLRFETDERIEIPLKIVQKLTAEQFQEVVSEELNRKFDSSRGLLRTILVRFAKETQLVYLITISHHAISDALSLVHLHSELLSYCQKPETNPTPLPFLPPPEALFPRWTRGIKAKLSSILFILRLFGKKAWYRPKTLSIEANAPIAERSCCIIHEQLEPELTKALITSCKQQGVTVQGALNAALLLAARDKIVSRKKKINVSCQTFVNLRKYLSSQVGNEHLSCLASYLLSFHTITPNTSFWKLARDVKQKIDKRIKSQDLFHCLINSQLLTNYILANRQQATTTVAVSNLGLLELPSDYGPYQLEEISFAGSNNLFAGVVFLNVNTFRGKMLMNFVFSKPSFSGERMIEIVENTFDYLRRACAKSRSQGYSATSVINAWGDSRRR